MIVANKTYILNFRGREHHIKRNDLKRLTNRLASGYRSASPERKNKIWEIILHLNWKYIYNAPFNFKCAMDLEDFRGWVVWYMRHALHEYQETHGDFTTYLASWKHAAFSRWQDQKDSVRLPANQRQALHRIRRKIRNNEELKEAEIHLSDRLTFSVCSMSAPFESEGGQVQDMLRGEDARESAYEPRYDDLWMKIRGALTPAEFTMFKWRYHDDYRLTLPEIGSRLGYTHENARLKLNKIKAKLALALKPLAKDLKD
jgi:RNA polymerase sigma factor (sigma-70 family)